jgi:hypothetical protein
MRILLYSMVLYLSGIAILLWLRPALMFKKNGEWKEFGMNNSDTTIFPFWLFCTVWAVITYALVSSIVSDEYMDLIKSASTASSVIATAESATPIPSAAPTLDLTQEEMGTAAGVANENTGKPGYYKLSETVLKKKGIPRYIYIGPDKPEDME